MKTERLDSRQLKAEALCLGFSHVGMAPAEPVPDEFMAYYERWLREGRQGDMHYLENHLALRRDPRLLLPGAKTVVSLAMSYHPGEGPTQKGLAWYAQGRDYHEVIRSRLQTLTSHLSPLTSFRICVDTAPILEKYWAWRCGLGWIGRHTQLVIPHVGSAFFLAELLLTAEVSEYQPLPTPGGRGSSCGSCHRCIDACPMQALSDEGLDARRCLSYLTIEHRGALPEDVAAHMGECFYGCDRCLQACPHLSRASVTAVADFRPSARLLAMTPADWSQLSREEYQELFRGSAVKRAKFEGLKRNIRIWENEIA